MAEQATKAVGGGWMNNLFIYIVLAFFYFLISTAASAAAPGCSGTVNTADWVDLGFHNAVCVVRGRCLFIYTFPLAIGG